MEKQTLRAFRGKANIPCRGKPFSRSLLGVKRTWGVAPHMSAYDPKRTSGLPTPSRVPIRIATISEVQGRPR
jgi:hypothetical protein